MEKGKKKVTQEDIVLREMQVNKKVTSMDGLRLGVVHVPGVIRNLKKKYAISTVRVVDHDTHKWYMVYSLA